MVNFVFRALPPSYFFKPDSGDIPFWYIQHIVKWVAKVINKHENKWSRDTTYSQMFCRTNRAPILIRPFINSMTKSELMAALIVVGNAAGSVLALYAWAQINS